MNYEWDLTKIYKSLDDPRFKEDAKALEESVKEYGDYVDSLDSSKAPGVEQLEKVFSLAEKESLLEYRQFSYLFLSQAVDTENGRLMGEMNRAMRVVSAGAGTQAKVVKLISNIEDIDAYAEKSEILNDYKTFLKRKKEAASHLLSDAEEELYASMDMTGGSAWGNLQSFLTSTVKVDYEGKTITLTEARNLAYDADKDVRKKAYDAEIASYEKIADSIAYSLNNIKLQVNMISKKRGYESPLMQALSESYMTKETLDAMIDAIKDHLPNIRKYFLHKAKLLGYAGSLNWWDMFAPLGEDNKKYTVEETKEVLTSTFEHFTPEMSDMMREAFDNNWIDFFPRNGKEGGAFDQGIPFIKESRVMTNFDGSFGSIDTLAHELGHSFHDRQVQDNRILNMDYPMQVAESASTFNETFLCNYFVERAGSDSEKVALLESLLREQTQCVVDIYSRYLFETSVFENCDEKFLMKEDLKELMHKAQVEAYGEGIKEDTLHPYMWACKSHYYSTGLSFYNFPYAFGALFAAGLYDMFLKEGRETFVPKYKAMLKATPTVSVEEAGSLMGIDLTKKKFWEDSLKIIEKNIEEFCEL